MEPTTVAKPVFAWSLPVAAALICSVLVAQAETDLPDAAATIASSRSVMVTVGGPRKGEAPGRYFNVQGLSSRGDSKFASFGLLDFHIEPGATKVAGAMRKATVVLTQSIPPFAKPGRLLLYLARNPDADIAGLKFATDAGTVLGDAAPDAIPCGEVTFTKYGTGHEDRFELHLSEDARPLLDRFVKEGGNLRVIVVPGEADVAATYFGVDQSEAAVRPSLLIE